MIGAKKGFKYSDGETQIEVYEYDADSDSYKKLLEQGYIDIEGFDTTMEASAINGNFVLFIDHYPCDQADLISFFKEIK